MMRFQRASPDYLPNGKKTSLRTTIPIRRDDSNGQENCRTVRTFTSSMEGKSLRLRSLSRDHDYHRRGNSPATTGIGYSGDGGVLLQWGQRRRARVSRIVNEEFHPKKARKKSVEQTPRGSVVAEDDSAATAAFLQPPGLSVCNGRVGNLRNSEDRSRAASKSPLRNTGGSSRVVSRIAAGKRSPPTPEKSDKKMSCSESAKDERANGSDTRKAEQEAGNNNNTAPAEKPLVEMVEWPRIYIALSKKEKEDDFLAMKGTKLPQRPKKRSKNVDKLLQYCFPGMWLSELTKSRYEVREKKCVKKQKRTRGLKGMESMDSDSE